MPTTEGGTTKHAHLNQNDKNTGNGYKSLAESLSKFNDLGQLPFQLDRLYECCGIEMALVANSISHAGLSLIIQSTYARAEK